MIIKDITEKQISTQGVILPFKKSNIFPIKINKSIEIIIVPNLGDVNAHQDPVPIIKRSVHLTKKFKNVEILWASTREAYNYMQSNKYGCSIITMPPSIIEKISKFGKSYQELTLDTVQKFLKDSKNSNFKI